VPQATEYHRSVYRKSIATTKGPTSQRRRQQPVFLFRNHSENCKLDELHEARSEVVIENIGDRQSKYEVNLAILQNVGV